MTASKQIIRADNGDYLILSTSKAGKVETVKYEKEAPSEAATVGRVLLSQTRAHGAIRQAMLTFLDAVLRHPRLDGFRRQPDTTLDESGKLPEGMAAAVRDCESELVRAYVADGSIKFHKNEDKEKAIQGFLSTLRSDKNYCAVKGTTLKFLAFVGRYPVDSDMNTLVPVAVMQALIAAALPEKQATDNSVFVRLQAIITEVFEDDSMTTESYQRLLSMAGNLTQTCKDGLEQIAINATQARSGAVSAIATAQAKAAEPALM